MASNIHAFMVGFRFNEIEFQYKQERKYFLNATNIYDSRF